MYRQLRLAMQQGAVFVLATLVEADPGLQKLVGQKLLITGSGTFGPLKDTAPGAAVEGPGRQALEQQHTRLVSVVGDFGEANVFVEPYHPAARLLVLGGGHIARPLVAIAALLEYQITVIDDRPSFANRQRFPEAQTVICDDFLRALQGQRIDAGTSVVVITRGHRHDLDCLQYVLQYQPGYVGMIGSHRRIRLVREHLLDSGYPEDRFTISDKARAIAGGVLEAVLMLGRGRFPA